MPAGPASGNVSRTARFGRILVKNVSGQLELLACIFINCTNNPAQLFVDRLTYTIELDKLYAHVFGKKECYPNTKINRIVFIYLFIYLFTRVCLGIYLQYLCLEVENKTAVFIVCEPFPIGVWGRMWNSIVSVPDHCLFIYLAYCTRSYVALMHRVSTVS